MWSVMSMINSTMMHINIVKRFFMKDNIYWYNDFIKISNIKHNYYYNYDEVKIFNHSKEKVCISCPAHGEFYQAVRNHKSGQKCPKCALIKTDAKTIFNRFIEVHGTRYDYSISKFTKMQSKIEILCKEHGIFIQKPHDHVNGQGCPVCAKEPKIEVNDLLQRFNIVHNFKYSYNLNAKILTSKKIDIACPRHGTYRQIVANHLAGHGCKKCSIEENSSKLKKGKSHFIKKCFDIHGDKYDYSLIEENVANHDKVEIICPTHGIFKQKLSNHITSKHGCPKCWIGGRYTENYFNLYPDKKTITARLYIMCFYNSEENFCKIGITKYDSFRRWKNHKHYSIVELNYITGTLYDIFILEQDVLKKYGYRNRYTPKISIGGDKECIDFSIMPKLFEYLEEIVRANPNLQIFEGETVLN